MKKQEKSLVKKSNTLINAKYSLSIIETKIMLFIISSLSRDDEDFKQFRFYTKDFLEMCGGSFENYTFIKKTFDGLLNKKIEIEEEDQIVLCHWLAGVTIKKGYIDVGIYQGLKPYLLQLKENYTAYLLKYALALQSAYGLRIYELLQQFVSSGFRVIDIEKFREILKIPESYQTKHLKPFILEPARAEIAEKTDISFTYHFMKRGRKYETIKFVIRKNKKSNKSQTQSTDVDTKNSEEAEETAMEGEEEKKQAEAIIIEATIVENATIITDTIPYVEIIDYLNLATSKNFKATIKKTKELVKARWDEGFELEDFKSVVDIMSSKWKNDRKFNDFLRPQTLFSDKFESYLNAKKKDNRFSDRTARNLEVMKEWYNETEEAEAPKGEQKKQQEKEEATIIENPTIITEKIPYQEIIDYLNGVASKDFKADMKATKKLIKARWDEGYRLEDFKSVIDIMSSKWKNDRKFNDFLRPQTLFSDKFESYLNAKQKDNRFSDKEAETLDTIKSWYDKRQKRKMKEEEAGPVEQEKDREEEKGGISLEQMSKICNENENCDNIKIMMPYCKVCENYEEKKKALRQARKDILTIEKMF